MQTVLKFFFSNLPLGIAHFVLFLYVFRWFGHPGFWVAGYLGAKSGSVLWWAIMVLNSFFWSGCITLILIPFLKKVLK